MPQPLFVGRAKELDEVLQLVGDAGNQGTLVALSGIHGIGKTSFLEHLAAEAREIDGIIAPLPVDMAAFGLGLDKEIDSVDALWDTFERSQQLLSALAELTGGTQFADFRLAVLAAANEVNGIKSSSNTITASDRSKVERIEQSSSVTYDVNTVKVSILSAQKQVDDAFVESWKAWAARSRMLLALDHFEAIAETALGAWALRMALRLPHLVTLTSWGPSTASPPTAAERVSVIELHPFTEDEVEEYLAARFEPMAIGPGIAKVAQRFTDGHPGGVKLVADLLSERDVTKVDANELHRTLDHLPDKPWEQWADLVKLILDLVAGSPLLPVLEAASIATTFDEPLLAALVGAEGVGEDIATLIGYGYVQRVETNREGPTDRFQVRPFVRRALERRVRTMQRSRWEELHRLAADHYFGLLESIEEGDDGYSGWYRYEKEAWQRAKVEWLFHSARLPLSAELTRARFALLFLEAFYWWGCYEDFPFTDRLLRDWSRPWTAGEAMDEYTVVLGDDPKDDQLREALGFVNGHYPLGPVKVSDQWGPIADALRHVQRLCGLGRGGASLEEADGRRLYGFIRTFLAHTERFAASDAATSLASGAGRYYEQALDSFEQLVARERGASDGQVEPGGGNGEPVDELWLVAWIQFEQADLFLEQGRLEDALAGLRASASTLCELTADGDDWDEELVADLCRLRADVHWSAGETDAAFTQYATAVRHAYRFNGIPHDPDAYTRRFYAEMTGRAGARVLELAAVDTDAATRAAAQLRATLSTEGSPVDAALLSGSATTSEQLGELLFPPGPGVNELGPERSAFMERWNRYDDQAPDTEPDVVALMTG